VDAVAPEQLVQPAVVVAADRHGVKSKRRRSEQDVLHDVAGLEQRETVAAEAVLETSTPEDGGDGDEQARLVG
jgi:hypothetical protein